MGNHAAYASDADDSLSLINRRYDLIYYSPSDYPFLCKLNRLTFHRDFEEIYGLGKEIGNGSFATVNICYDKDSHSHYYAVKEIDKRYLSDKEMIGLRDEIQILRRTENEHIIKLYDVFDDGKNS